MATMPYREGGLGALNVLQESDILHYFPGMGFRYAIWVTQRDQYGDKMILIVAPDDDEIYLSKYGGEKFTPYDHLGTPILEQIEEVVSTVVSPLPVNPVLPGPGVVPGAPGFGIPFWPCSGCGGGPGKPGTPIVVVPPEGPGTPNPPIPPIAPIPLPPSLLMALAAGLIWPVLSYRKRQRA